MSLLTSTSWAYDSSREESVSIAVVTGGSGSLGLNNSATGGHVDIGYHYRTLGTSKGAVINYAASVATTPGGGIGNVQTLPFGSFNSGLFPCFGWLVAIGATAGIFAPSFFDNSGRGVCLWIFGGLPPSAVLLTWGNFDSALPSGGISAGYLSFDSASYHDANGQWALEWS